MDNEQETSALGELLINILLYIIIVIIVIITIIIVIIIINYAAIGYTVYHFCQKNDC